MTKPFTLSLIMVKSSPHVKWNYSPKKSVTISPEPVALQVYTLIHHWKDYTEEERTDVTVHMNLGAVVFETKRIVRRHFVSGGEKLNAVLDSNNFLEIADAFSSFMEGSHRFELYACELVLG